MTTFSDVFCTLPLEALRQQSLDTTERTLFPVLERGRATSLADFAALISPAGEKHLETMGRLSQELTRKHFGKTIRLFAPLYLSNECVNICKYCGFSRNNDIPRITLPVSQVVDEVKMLASKGFRSILLVAGEHPKFVSNGYVEEVIRSILPITPGILLELGPLETDPYRPLVAAGCEGLVVYQETYHQPTYEELHTAGPKRRFFWRMDTPERAYAAGFRRLGIGALFGLYDWRSEALAVAAHALYLTRRCWKAQISVSLPRMRPASGNFEQSHFMQNREFVQTLCALRLLLPHASIVLSTREPAKLRDGLVTLGVTNMSAGSSTEPGGYSSFDETSWTPTGEQKGEQFHISDERPPQVVAEMIRSRGYEAVWKDFDEALVH
jgi:2-iminoacetate synthase